MADGAVVASWSRSKGYRYLSTLTDIYDDETPHHRTWQLRPEGEGKELRPREILTQSGLQSPFFRCWHLEYNPKAQQVSAIETVDERGGFAPSLEWMLRSCLHGAQPGKLRPGRYIEISVHSSAPPLPPLGSRINPVLGLLRPSEHLALTLMIHGAMSIDQAATAMSAGHASVKAAAAALTRKGVIEPVGKGVMIRPLPSIGEPLEPFADTHPWLGRLVRDKRAQAAMRARASIPTT